jgi:hypothetical protein
MVTIHTYRHTYKHTYNTLPLPLYRSKNIREKKNTTLKYNQKSGIPIPTKETKKRYKRKNNR